MLLFSHLVVSPALWDPMNCSTPGFPVLHYLREFAQTHVHWVSDVIQPSHPLLPFVHLPSVFPSIRVFSNEWALCIRWPKYWSFSFNTSPSNEYSGSISFEDWLVWSHCSPRDSQESSPAPQLKTSILQCSAFFMVQLSHPYMTTRKAINLTI